MIKKYLYWVNWSKWGCLAVEIVEMNQAHCDSFARFVLAPYFLQKYNHGQYTFLYIVDFFWNDNLLPQLCIFLLTVLRKQYSWGHIFAMRMNLGFYSLWSFISTAGALVVIMVWGLSTPSPSPSNILLSGSSAQSSSFRTFPLRECQFRFPGI